MWPQVFLTSMSDLRPLQRKAEQSFNAFFEKYKEDMACAQGCSRCCVGGLSVFAWEAAIITDWFHALSPEQKAAWKERQEVPSSQNQPFINSDGDEDRPCAFLRGDSCSIYEARPSLCRTQGMALSLKSEQGERLRDWCPLNFSTSEPQSQDDLNLDQLNAMLSQAQLIHERENPEALGPLRVDLSDLRDYLLRC